MDADYVRGQINVAISELSQMRDLAGKMSTIVDTLKERVAVIGIEAQDARGSTKFAVPLVATREELTLMYDRFSYLEYHLNEWNGRL
jgi:hypothetical protein